MTAETFWRCDLCGKTTDAGARAYWIEVDVSIWSELEGTGWAEARGWKKSHFDICESCAPGVKEALKWYGV